MSWDDSFHYFHQYAVVVKDAICDTVYILQKCGFVTIRYNKHRIIKAQLLTQIYNDVRVETNFKHYQLRKCFYKWDKVFKNGPSKIFGRQPLKNLKGYGLPKADHNPSNFLKAVFQNFYLVHSWTKAFNITTWWTIRKKRDTT